MPQLAIRLTDADHATLLTAAERADSLGGYTRDAALAAAAHDAAYGQAHARAALDRYGEVCLRCRPALSPGEWRVIVDAHKGPAVDVLLAGTGRALASLVPEVADYLEMDARSLEPRAKAWGVDGPALVRRLVELGPAAKVAVLDVVDRFWGSASSAVPGEEGWVER
jgi:hypothetical protein